MDIKHHVFTLLCSGDLHLAPLVKPRIILDIGTGTGIWAIGNGRSIPGVSNNWYGSVSHPAYMVMVPCLHAAFEKATFLY